MVEQRLRIGQPQLHHLADVDHVVTVLVGGDEPAVEVGDAASDERCASGSASDSRTSTTSPT